MIQGSVSKSWLHREGGFTFPEAYYFDPVRRWEEDREIARYLDKRFPDYPIYNMESNLVQAEFADPEMIPVGGIQPNLILGGILGAEFVFPEGNDGDILGKPLEYISDGKELPEVNALLNHDLVRRLDDQIRMLQRRYPERRIVPPFFWDLSGRASVHGIITSSFKFVGERIYILLFEDPKLVQDIHRWLLKAYKALIGHFSGLAGLPVTGVHIGECSGAMMSAKDFSGFVKPFVDDLGKTYGNVRFHSCGTSNHLLEEISRIYRLSSLDTGSDTSVADARRILGTEMLIELAPPAELMMEGRAADELLQWLDRVLEENKKGPLKLGYHLEAGYSFENIRKLHEELVGRGLAKPGRLTV